MGLARAGSEARREQGLHSDQDHAIAYDSPAEEVDPYFASVAGTVTANLEAAGIPRCPGEVVATERPLRRPLDHWVKAFRGWMSDLGVEGSFQASIVFDYRRVAGTLDAETPLDESARRRVIRGSRPISPTVPSTFARRSARSTGW